jgi:hypothetical protein
VEQQTPVPDWATPQIEALIGSFRLAEVHRDGTGRTGVWEVASQNQRFFFKTHNRRGRWGSEVYAYNTWGHAFSPYLAELIGVFDAADHFGLLLRGVAGHPLRHSNVTEKAAIGVYHEAALCLRRLCQLDVQPWPWFGSAVADDGQPLSKEEGLALARPTDATNVMETLWESAEEKAERLGCLAPGQKRLLDVLRPLIGAFADEMPVPTHNDFTPGNWLVNSRGKLSAIIDLENMFYGLRIDPFIRLVADYFPANICFQKAFMDGFGDDILQRLPQQIAVGLTLHGLYYLCSGTQKGDAGQTQRGVSALRRAEQLVRAEKI